MPLPDYADQHLPADLGLTERLQNTLDLALSSYNWAVDALLLPGRIPRTHVPPFRGPLITRSGLMAQFPPSPPQTSRRRKASTSA